MPSAAVRCLYDVTQTPHFSSFHVEVKPFPTSLGPPFSSPSHVHLHPILRTSFLLLVIYCTSSQLQLALPCVSHVLGGILDTIWSRELLQAPKSRLNVPSVCTLKSCPSPLLGALCRQNSVLFTFSIRQLGETTYIYRRKERKKKEWREEMLRRRK